MVDKGESYIDPRGHKHGGAFTLRALRTVAFPREPRWKIRSRTFQGIANAMAEQWG